MLILVITTLLFSTHSFLYNSILTRSVLIRNSNRSLYLKIAFGFVYCSLTSSIIQFTLQYYLCMPLNTLLFHVNITATFHKTNICVYIFSGFLSYTHLNHKCTWSYIMKLHGHTRSLTDWLTDSIIRLYKCLDTSRYRTSMRHGTVWKV